MTGACVRAQPTKRDPHPHPIGATRSMAITKGRSSTSSSTATLKAGDDAPDFELDTQNGEKWKLSDMRGKKNVVLAFYPFAFTPV